MVLAVRGSRRIYNYIYLTGGRPAITHLPNSRGISFLGWVPRGTCTRLSGGRGRAGGLQAGVYSGRI